jgi:hypothetical protein
MLKKESAEQLGEGGPGRKRPGTQAGQLSREEIQHEVHAGKGAASSAKNGIRTLYIDCPYCDGENIVRYVSQSHKTKVREIACPHCQCLFTSSEINIRRRVIEGTTLEETDAAA